MNQDVIHIEVLEDGRLVVSTDQISAPNHINADQLLKELARMMGGQVTSNKRPHAAHAQTIGERTHVHG